MAAPSRLRAASVFEMRRREDVVRCRPCHAGMRRSEPSHGVLGRLVDRARRSANVPRPARPRGVDDRLPRVGLATSATGPEPSVACLAMLAGLTHRSWRVQHFRTRACLTAKEAVGQVTGLPGRHLDPWLMPAAVCRGLFARAGATAELSVVEGTLGDADRRLVGPMVRASGRPAADRRGARPADPRGGLLPRGRLRYVPPADDPRRGRRASCWTRSPTPRSCRGSAGWSSWPPGCRSSGRSRRCPSSAPRSSSMPPDRRLPEDLIEALARGFLQHADLPALDELARRRPVPGVAMRWYGLGGGGRRRFRVAYAQDEAFGGYFPDTIESLEALGADLVEFSPLRDEALPDGVGLVMIGCGLPDHHADELASNLSMIAALGEHVCLGRRIYSEGGGTAYLGRSMIIGGRRYRGAGILPFDAEFIADAPPPVPVSRRLLHDSLAGPSGHGRPRLQERPMAADPGPRALRVPRLLRRALRRGRLVLPPSCRRQPAAPPPGRAAGGRRRLRGAPSPLAQAPDRPRPGRARVRSHAGLRPR